jgi:HAD superfamily hydrolase (TIGR01509 family)
MVIAVIFDMDGVIIDSEKYWGKADFPFLKSLIPSWDWDKHQKIIGISISDIYPLLKSKFNIKIDKKGFVKTYHNVANEIYKDKVSLMPGFLDFIKALKREDFKTALASSSPPSWINIVTNRFNISKFFDKIVSSYNLDFTGKPEPDIFLYTAKKLNMKPDNCVVIEDSENGVASAKAASMKCIGFDSGFKKHDLSKADLIVKGFSELSPDKIRKLIQGN